MVESSSAVCNLGLVVKLLILQFMLSSVSDRKPRYVSPVRVVVMRSLGITAKGLVSTAKHKNRAHCLATAESNKNTQ